MTEKQLIDWLYKRGWSRTADKIIEKDYAWLENKISQTSLTHTEYLEYLKNYLRKEKLKKINEQG